MTSTTDLSKLPLPEVIEALDFETIRAERKARLEELDPELGAALVAGDPIFESINAASYRELYLRQRGNDIAKALLLAHSYGANLDNIGAFWDVARLTLQAEDLTASPPIPEIKEADDPYREAIHEKPRVLGTGSKTRYERSALEADSRIFDVHGHVPAPAQLTLEWVPDVGTDPGDYPEITQNIADYVGGTDAEGIEITLLTDLVSVQVCSPIAFDVIATLHLSPGPDPAFAIDEANANIVELAARVREARAPNPLSEIYQALSSPIGVRKVDLASPGADGASVAASYYEIGTISISFLMADWL